MTTLSPAEQSLARTRRGKLTLLCCAPSRSSTSSTPRSSTSPCRRSGSDLGFSIQNLQWVLSGYLLTYGGFLLLGGRAADLLGRRRLLVAGTSLFALSSLVGGLAPSAGVLIGARVAQGLGAAMMAPAALSILTTTFAEGRDRHKALGAWGGMPALAAAAGVFLGGVLADGPGWRWVFFVNLPVCLRSCVAAFRLLPADAARAARQFDILGAVLATAGMLLLVYAIVEAPGHRLGRHAHDRRAGRRAACSSPGSPSTSSAAATRCSRSRSSASRASPPPTPRS